MVVVYAELRPFIRQALEGDEQRLFLLPASSALYQVSIRGRVLTIRSTTDTCHQLQQVTDMFKS